MADFTKQELETILKGTEDHLAETRRMGPGYYGIRERYDYAVEVDERYIEKLKKQIAEYDQDKLNENQEIVLEWLKDDFKEYGDPISAIGDLGDEILPSRWETCLQATYEKLDTQQKWEVLAAFAEWGMKEVTK